MAELLFITQATVEATLSRIYTKLGIRSRTELAVHLERRPAHDDSSNQT